ncbi:hypothetical protein BS78_10G149500 [Paspalum vaginatum]|nr:hypothetical protein BS78_10G149500 [Paspalum vaginatum]
MSFLGLRIVEGLSLFQARRPVTCPAPAAPPGLPIRASGHIGIIALIIHAHGRQEHVHHRACRYEPAARDANRVINNSGLQWRGH